MTPYCPICGQRFSAVELVLVERDVNFQCKNCWNRVRPAKMRQAAVRAMNRPRDVRSKTGPRRKAA
jgi:hypothetical protein